MARWQGFYSTAQVSRIARVPRSTLSDWRRRGIIAPSVEVIAAGEPVEVGYSYADLTIIKIMRALREDRLNLTSVGIALRHLYERLGPPSKGWADAHVYVVRNRILAEMPDEWETTTATQFGQRIETRLFGDLFTELRRREEPGSILVPEGFTAHVEIDPEVMGGQPVVKGTRVPTSILAMLSNQGKSLDEIAWLYRPVPKLSVENAIEYERFLDTAIP